MADDEARPDAVRGGVPGKTSSWGPDFFEALHALGYVDRRVILQHTTIDHDQEDFSTVTIRCHLRPDDLAAIANRMAEG